MRLSRCISALLLLAACGAPARPASPRVVVIPALPRAEPARPPSLEEQAARARAEVGEDAIVAEHRARIDGEARVHLVLDRDRCYRVWVGADRAIDARLEDEHGHVVARGGGWLPEICPRWTGSFRLVVGSDDYARALAVIVAARDSPPAP